MVLAPQTARLDRKILPNSLLYHDKMSLRKPHNTPAATLAVVASLGAGGCSTPGPSFESAYPASRIGAIQEAGARKDLEAVPDLIHMLASDDPATRVFAIRTLEGLSGQTLGYSHAAGASERAAAIERWNAWYRAETGNDADAMRDTSPYYDVTLGEQLAAIATAASFGDPIEEEPSFDAEDSAARLAAIRQAAADGDRDAIPGLIRSLSSDDPAARLLAIRTLEQFNGGRDLGYDHGADESDRRAAIGRWITWYENASGRAWPTDASRTSLDGRTSSTTLTGTPGS